MCQCISGPLSDPKAAGREGGDAGDFFRLPFLTKSQMGQDFPHNFLRPGHALTSRLESLLRCPGEILAVPTDLLLPEPSGKFRLTCRA